MYYQPLSILNFYNSITSSWSLSPTVMQGTPLPFSCPSIVNTFLRRTVFSPNNEIFTMRPNKLTRCIFKSNVLNMCRIENYATIYKRIHEIKKNISRQRIINSQSKLRYACVYIQLIPPQRGEFAWKCYWDRKFGKSFNIFADSAWNDGNSRKNDVWLTGAFVKPANPSISFVISVRPSVRPFHVSTRLRLVDFTWNLILASLIKIFRGIPNLLQSSINRAMQMKT
jgi:hypothetical protein